MYIEPILITWYNIFSISVEHTLVDLENYLDSRLADYFPCRAVLNYILYACTVSYTHTHTHIYIWCTNKFVKIYNNIIHAIHTEL